MNCKHWIITKRMDNSFRCKECNLRFNEGIGN